MSSYSMAQPAGSAAGPQAAEQRLKLEKAVENGANWFYWIAGLSMVNTIIAATGSDWGFIFGLGISSALGFLSHEMGMAGKVVLLVISLGIAGLFVLFGSLARRRLKWGFVAGMALYGLDGGLSFLAGDWKGVIFHAVALLLMIGGLTATIKLAQMDASVPGLSTVKLD